MVEQKNSFEQVYTKALGGLRGHASSDLGDLIIYVMAQEPMKLYLPPNLALSFRFPSPLFPIFPFRFPVSRNAQKGHLLDLAVLIFIPRPRISLLTYWAGLRAWGRGLGGACLIKQLCVSARFAAAGLGVKRGRTYLIRQSWIFCSVAASLLKASRQIRTTPIG